jgi:hypothetical protein
MGALISRIKNKQWKRFDGEGFPKRMLEVMQEKEVWRSRYGQVYGDTIWYKGNDPDTAEEFCFVMDDGGYYKVFAQYSFWHTVIGREGTPVLALQCVWSFAHLKRTMRSYLETSKTLFDPQYHT